MESFDPHECCLLLRGFSKAGPSDPVDLISYSANDDTRKRLADHSPTPPLGAFSKHTAWEMRLPVYLHSLLKQAKKQPAGFLLEDVNAWAY
jgi:hypothetical protein